MRSTQGPSRIVVAEPVSPAGIELLEAEPGFQVIGAAGLSRESLAERLAVADALLVGAATAVDSALLESAPNLRALARVGTSLENVDVAAATGRGIAVFATPDGSTTSAAEHAMAMLLALARNLARADRAVRRGAWTDPSLVGVELRGKTLGLVGFGQVGEEVARRALAFDLALLVHDPFVRPERIRELGGQAADLDDLLRRSDFIGVHAASTEATRRLLDFTRLQLVRPGARLVHGAALDLLDQEAVLAALEAGRLAGVAMDVPAAGPRPLPALLQREDVLVTPGLVGATREAEDEVGRIACERIRAFLTSGSLDGAVNFPAIAADRRPEAAAFMDLADRVGRFLGAVTPGAPEALEAGLARVGPGLPLEAVTSALARGVLARAVGDGMPLVGALDAARRRGLLVSGSDLGPAESGAGGLAVAPGGTLHASLRSSGGARKVVATHLGGRPRLLSVDGAAVDTDLSGHLLYFASEDQPGVLGRLGTSLAESGTNIASIHLGRCEPEAAGGGAPCVGLVATDQPVPAAAIEALRRLPQVESVHSVELPPRGRPGAARPRQSAVMGGPGAPDGRSS